LRSAIKKISSATSSQGGLISLKTGRNRGGVDLTKGQTFGVSMDGGEHHIGLVDTPDRKMIFISVTLDADVEEARRQEVMAIFESIKVAE
jgi:hypothetical protein